MTAVAVEGAAGAKIALALAIIARDATWSSAEDALIREVASTTGEVRRALQEREHRQHLARGERARAEEAEREAERAERVATRRAKWRATDPLVRACHVLAERVRADSSNGKLLLELAALVGDPSATLLTKKRYGIGADERTERAPPVTFEPSGYEHDDPVRE